MDNLQNILKVKDEKVSEIRESFLATYLKEFD
jgi:hypothetical protein